jgi:predicted amidohydrolase YtcJ
MWSTISMLCVTILAADPPPGATDGPKPRPTPAELVIRRGAVYTLDAARSWAGAVAVSEGRIVFVGLDENVDPWIGPGTRVVDAAGGMVLPGFHDAHTHPASGGIRATLCALDELLSEDQIREAIRAYAQRNPDKPWIRGAGWQLPIFKNANPHKSFLDEIVPDRPVYLSAADGHSAWVNSKALALAGITAETPDPPTGRIERDPRTREPTGTLREAAMELVAKVMPEYTHDELLTGLRDGLREYARLGITAFHDASVDENLIKAYAELDRRGELSARVVASLYADPAQGEKQVPRLVALRQKYRGNRLRPDAVKIFADGVIEAKTAALLEPYEGSDSDRGKPNWEPEVLNRTVIALDKEGFQVHVHAIGDRAIRMALDAFEAARAANGARDARHHIAHLQLLDPHDIPRFRRLGVVANFQPLWAQADPYIRDLTEPVLGPARSRWLYAIESVVKSGAVVVFGSDWPVTSPNPLEAIQVAVTRRVYHPEPGPVWIPEERIDLGAALAGYTINGAYLSFQEKRTGSIEVGKSADLIVLDRNLFDLPPEQIRHARARLTVLEGRVVYESTAR